MPKTETIKSLRIKFENLDDNKGPLANIALSKVALDIIAAAVEGSPVDKGIFKAEWSYASDLVKPSGVLSQITVFNRMPYGPAIEFGSEKGEKPWPNAGPKTTEKDGRIWSKQAVGGVLNQILTGPYTAAVAEDVRNFVFGGFK